MYIQYLLFIKILFVKITILQAQNIIILSLFFLFISIVLRLIIRTIQKQLLKSNIGSRRAIIIGGGENTKKLIQQIKDINILGYNILGYFYSKNDKSIAFNI